MLHWLFYSYFFFHLSPSCIAGYALSRIIHGIRSENYLETLTDILDDWIQLIVGIWLVVQT